MSAKNVENHQSRSRTPKIIYGRKKILQQTQQYSVCSIILLYGGDICARQHCNNNIIRSMPLDSSVLLLLSHL